MTKKDYRAFFANVKPILKLKYFCSLCGVDAINLSRFMRSEDMDWCMSIDKLNTLYQCIINELQKIG